MSRHSHTVPLGFSTMRKLLPHLAVHLHLVVAVSAVHIAFPNLLNGSCSAYAKQLGGTWYSFASSVTLNEKVPLKHKMPVNTLLNSLCIFIVALEPVALFLCLDLQQIACFQINLVISTEVIFIIIFMNLTSQSVA